MFNWISWVYGHGAKKSPRKYSGECSHGFFAYFCCGTLVWNKVHPPLDRKTLCRVALTSFFTLKKLIVRLQRTLFSCVGVFFFSSFIVILKNVIFYFFTMQYTGALSTKWPYFLGFIQCVTIITFEYPRS